MDLVKLIDAPTLPQELTEEDVRAMVQAAKNGKPEEARAIVEGKGLTWLDSWEKRSPPEPLHE